MGFITISSRELDRAKIVDPGWYRVKIEGMAEKTAKNGKSQNHFPEGTIQFNGDNGSTQFAGIPTPIGWCFNELAPGFMVGFLAACGIDMAAFEERVRAAGKDGVRINMDDAVGKEIDIFIENDLYDGRTVNRINHKYRKPLEGITAR